MASPWSLPACAISGTDFCSRIGRPQEDRQSGQQEEYDHRHAEARRSAQRCHRCHQERRKEARRASGQRIDAEIAPGLIGRNAARHVGTRRSLHRSERNADEQSEADIGFFRRRSEQAAAIGTRQLHDTEQGIARTGRDDADRRDGQQDQRDHHHDLSTRASCRACWRQDSQRWRPRSV